MSGLRVLMSKYCAHRSYSSDKRDCAHVFVCMCV
jgi:hypothetical protein